MDFTTPLVSASDAFSDDQTSIEADNFLASLSSKRKAEQEDSEKGQNYTAMGNARKKPSIIDIPSKEKGVGKFKSNLKIFSDIGTVCADEGQGVQGEGVVQNDMVREEAQNFGLLGTRQCARVGEMKFLIAGTLSGSSCTGGKTGYGESCNSTK